MKWIEITVKTNSQAVEPLTAFFEEKLHSQGVRIDDPSDISSYQKNDPSVIFEKEKFFGKSNEVTISSFFSEDKDVKSYLILLKEQLDWLKNKLGLETSPAIISTKILDEKDWENSWKQYYHPTHITDNIVIVPTWETYSKKPNEIVVSLDPGMAFGTGGHSTTKLMAEYLESIIQNKNSILDIGTGSGILSIISKKLGAGSIVATDIDSMAVNIAKENFEINDVSENSEIIVSDLLANVKKQKFDIIVANIVPDILILLMQNIQVYMHSQSKFLLSGISKNKASLIIENLKKNELEIINQNEENGWVSFETMKREQ